MHNNHLGLPREGMFSHRLRQRVFQSCLHAGACHHLLQHRYQPKRSWLCYTSSAHVLVNGGQAAHLPDETQSHVALIRTSRIIHKFRTRGFQTLAVNAVGAWRRSLCCRAARQSSGWNSIWASRRRPNRLSGPGRTNSCSAKQAPRYRPRVVCPFGQSHLPTTPLGNLLLRLQCGTLD